MNEICIDALKIYKCTQYLRNSIIIALIKICRVDSDSPFTQLCERCTGRYGDYSNLFSYRSVICRVRGCEM